MLFTPNPNEICTLNIEIKLHINQRLFEKGYITEEMYEKAKEKIIKN